MPSEGSDRVFEKWLSVFGLVLLLSVSFGVTIEVVFRKLFSMSLGGVDELSGYGFSVFTSFAFVLAIKEKANIRIDLLRNASPKLIRVILDLFAAFAFFGFLALLSGRAVLLVVNSFERGSKAITPLATPLYIPQALWTAGLLLATLVLGLMICCAILALWSADTKRFWALLAPTHEEDHAEDYAVTDFETFKKSEA